MTAADDWIDDVGQVDVLGEVLDNEIDAVLDSPHVDMPPEARRKLLEARDALDGVRGLIWAALDVGDVDEDIL